MIERGNKSEIVPGGCHINVAAWLVGLGLHGKAISVTLRDVVFAKVVDGFAQALHRLVGTAAGIGFNALSAAPQDENLRTKFGAEVHSPHCFLQRIGSHFGIVGSKSAVAKYGMEK